VTTTKLKSCLEIDDQKHPIQLTVRPATRNRRLKYPSRQTLRDDIKPRNLEKRFQEKTREFSINVTCCIRLVQRKEGRKDIITCIIKTNHKERIEKKSVQSSVLIVVMQCAIRYNQINR
jgi:hypothetical protein